MNFQTILEIVRRLWAIIAPAVGHVKPARVENIEVDHSAPKTWQNAKVPRQIEAAAEFFKKNVAIYERCSALKSDRWPFVLHLVKGTVFSGRWQYESGGTTGRTFTRLVLTGASPYNPAKFGEPLKDSKGNVKFYTFCNQVASLYTLEACGIDLDYYPDLTDPDWKNGFNANKIFNRLTAGRYNTKKIRFAPCSHSTAQAFAAEGCLVLAAWRNPNPKASGHIAVMQPDGNFTQAGLYTGFDISPARAFGLSNLPAVKYWVLQVRV